MRVEIFFDISRPSNGFSKAILMPKDVSQRNILKSQNTTDRQIPSSNKGRKEAVLLYIQRYHSSGAFERLV